MEHSDSIANIAAALCAFQAKLKPLERNANNPFFGKNYVDLANLSETTLPLLTAEGLSIVQGGDGNSLETMLMHTSGEWLRFSMPLPQIADPQKFTAAVTYFRRSGWSCITGATAEGEDDDGNAASHPQGPRPAPSPATRPPAETGARPETAPAAPREAAGGSPAFLTVIRVDTTVGEKNDKPWTRYTAKFSDGTMASTFDTKQGEALAEAKAKNLPVSVGFERAGKFVNIKSVTVGGGHGSGTDEAVPW